MKFPQMFSGLAQSKFLQTLFGGSTGGWLAGWLGDEGGRLGGPVSAPQGVQDPRHGISPAAPGELELVARDGDCIVFVEVKTRAMNWRASRMRRSMPASRRSFTRLALAFLKRYRLLEQPARFNVVSIIWEGISGGQGNRSFSKRVLSPPAGGRCFRDGVEMVE